MKYYTFYRENNNFDDILSDTNLKKLIHYKIKWYQHVLIGLAGKSIETIHSYITLKYGDEIRTNLTKDYKPIEGVDYIAKNKKF
jgi:hypothetical protein